jgi:hypothetical protein
VLSRCKGTTKNPNVQINFYLFCHLQDFATVTSGEKPLFGAWRSPKGVKNDEICKKIAQKLPKICIYAKKVVLLQAEMCKFAFFNRKFEI